MKLNLKFHLLLYSSLFTFFCSCSKDELTKPAPVSLQMEMVSEEVPFQEQGKKTYIRIEKARYRFSSLDFEGYRQVGNDYFFTKEFDNNFDVWVEQGQQAKVLDFDMPQGDYDQVKVSLKIIKSTGRAKEEGKKNEKSTLSYSENASILMEGYYTNTHQQEVPLIFVYDFDETFDYTVDPGTGTSAISVDKNQNNKAVVQFDAIYWMQLINGRMLQSAKLTDVEGEATIIISADQNEHIFNLLSSRIKNASKLSFK